MIGNRNLWYKFTFKCDYFVVFGVAIAEEKFPTMFNNIRCSDFNFRLKYDLTMVFNVMGFFLNENIKILLRNPIKSKKLLKNLLDIQTLFKHFQPTSLEIAPLLSQCQRARKTKRSNPEQFRLYVFYSLPSAFQIPPTLIIPLLQRN